MERNEAVGIMQTAGGAYVGYQSLKHGLPRAMGIRIEYHVTSKDNAEMIKKSGNILNPDCGGKSGWADKINSSYCIENSKGYVHITGMHKDNNTVNKDTPKIFRNAFGSFYRKLSNLMYQTLGNTNADEFKQQIKSNKKLDIITWAAKQYFKNIFNNNTVTLCIPGIESYFNTNFINDEDSEVALKTSKPVKAYNNRFSAMIAGIKKYGLQGIKENKTRAAIGTGLVASGAYCAAKLISTGIDKIKNSKNNKTINL